MVSAAHQREREGGDASVSPSMANKDALVRYISLFPDVTRAVRERRARDEPSSSGQEGQCLVGFGEHHSVSYRDLYQAQDREKRSYVQWIRQQKVRTGTKMEALQKFIQRRDEQPARDALCACSGYSTPSPRSTSTLRYHLNAKHVGANVQRPTPTRDQSGRLALNLRLWWSPPGPRLVYMQPPSSPDAFFHSRLFLWMPYRMWAFKLLCVHPECRRLGHKLTACGMYKTVRRVLDFSGWYFMATEYLECRRCKKMMAGWSQDILDQLDPVHREKFPAILTYGLSKCQNLACSLLRQGGCEPDTRLHSREQCDLAVQASVCQAQTAMADPVLPSTSPCSRSVWSRALTPAPSPTSCPRWCQCPLQDGC
ncbi:uncharacterized protein LOC143477983 [Brachyhypopomus gauderio]|uniref:uncharacterized protein LOC143477983 n=1 Tax=Brachyhypopomus gauderio TaxID=698409 RepID=UPI0040421EB6